MVVRVLVVMIVRMFMIVRMRTGFCACGLLFLGAGCSRALGFFSHFGEIQIDLPSKKCRTGVAEKCDSTRRKVAGYSGAPLLHSTRLAYKGSNPHTPYRLRLSLEGVNTSNRTFHSIDCPGCSTIIPEPPWPAHSSPNGSE